MELIILHLQLTKLELFKTNKSHYRTLIKKNDHVNDNIYM